jgi:cytochrome c556
MKIALPSALLAVALLIPACQAPTSDAQDTLVIDATVTASPTAQAQLDSMDQRIPVPLQPMMANHMKQMMRGHLEALQAINIALGEENWAGVEQAAALLGSGSEGRQMCKRMGQGAPGFYEMGVSFHTQADAIATAAKAQDTQGVLRATGQTMAICSACHTIYRQEVLSSEDYTKRLNEKAPWENS